MAAARWYGREQLTERPLLWSMLLWSSLSLLPDADVLGLSMGVAYAAPWGHRGATHSFVFAAVGAAFIGVITRLSGRDSMRPSVLGGVVLASHPLLDTLTNGGLGCALFWPVDQTRYFAPWTPLPVAPIGFAFFSFYGLVVAVVELVVFSPLFLFAWRPVRLAAESDPLAQDKPLRGHEERLHATSHSTERVSERKKL